MEFILRVMSDLAQLGLLALQRLADPPPTLEAFLRTTQTEADSLRADLAGRQDAEDVAELEAP